MARLVFRPYTQIWRSICTSESLRASTRVSPGFTLFRHRSPPFGSRHVCSHSDLSPKREGPADCASQESNHCHFHCAPRVCHSCTRTHVWLLGPCFKTGRRKQFCQHHEHMWLPSDHPSTHLPALTPHQGVTSLTDTCTQLTWYWPTAACSAQVASHQRNTHHCNTRFLRFPFSNFRYSLTLFSKFFASFPHGTCSLSVYHQYLAPTTAHSTQAHTGVSPSQLPCSKGLCSGLWQSACLQTTIRCNLFCAQIHMVGSSRFSRPYWGNPS